MTAPIGAGAVMALARPLGWWPAASATVTALAAFLLNVVIRLPAVAVLATAGILAVVICILRGRRK